MFEIGWSNVFQTYFYIKILIYFYYSVQKWKAYS
jgi:hypothetical protein